jgi:hypothetical protein
LQKDSGAGSGVETPWFCVEPNSLVLGGAGFHPFDSESLPIHIAKDHALLSFCICFIANKACYNFLTIMPFSVVDNFRFLNSANILQGLASGNLQSSQEIQGIISTNKPALPETFFSWQVNEKANI